eukprot:1160012-Pelagomonas_calceolata.AAC.11
MCCMLGHPSRKLILCACSSPWAAGALGQDLLVPQGPEAPFPAGCGADVQPRYRPLAFCCLLIVVGQGSVRTKRGAMRESQEG